MSKEDGMEYEDLFDFLVELKTIVDRKPTFEEHHKIMTNIVAMVSDLIEKKPKRRIYFDGAATRSALMQQVMHVIDRNITIDEAVEMLRATSAK